VFKLFHTRHYLLAVVGIVVFFIGGGVLFYSGADKQLVESPPPSPAQTGQPGFREQAREAGLNFRMAFLPDEQGEKFKVNLYDHGCGVAVGDFDGDGFEDVYFVNQLGPNALYRNKGDGTFEDVTAKAGVGLGDRICVGATFADYDNDGRLDLYVTSTRGGNVLFRNMGDGKFKDVTKEAGLTLVAHSQTAAFFDFDNDGYLDLIVTNTARWTLNNYDKAAHYFPGLADLWLMAESPREYNVLYRNKGDGTFEDVTAKAGLAGVGWSGDVAIFDYDEDGWLDVFVTNMFGANQLYHNNRNGTFTQVDTVKVLGRTSWGAIGTKAFDFDNDGHLDLFTVDMHSDMWLPNNMLPRDGQPYNLRKKYPNVTGPRIQTSPPTAEFEKMLVNTFKFRYEDVVFGNTLFRKLPNGLFEEVSDRANLETWWPWGIATGDFDNDGFEDVFIPSGMGYPYGYWPNALMMNNGDRTFTDRAATLGIEPPPGGIHLDEKIGGQPAARSSRCAVVGDFDGDGRLDLIVNNFNDRPYYFRNELPQQNYIAFRLTGRRSNRDAIGALVWVYPVGGGVMVRQVHAAGGYLSHGSRTLHFGLGSHTEIERVEILWPRGIRERIDHLKINMRHDRTEPAK
jgi:hypothetical protein